MSRSLYENHWGSPTLTLLNVLGVLGVLNVLNVLNVLYVLYVLNVLHMLNVLHVLHGRIVGLLGLVYRENSSFLAFKKTGYGPTDHRTSKNPGKVHVNSVYHNL